MPRIPKNDKTKFPSRAYIQTSGPRVGSIRRFRNDPGRDGYVHLMKGPNNLWWETEYEPLQGPDLPRDIEKYRQQMIDAIESGNTRRELSRSRAYEEAWAKERALQAYNRKVAAWNEYVGMSPEERKFWANRGKLEDAMMDYKLDMDPSWYTKNYENFTYLPSRPTPDYSSATQRSINIHDYPSYDDFDEFPDELSNAPWRRY